MEEEERVHRSPHIIQRGRRRRRKRREVRSYNDEDTDEERQQYLEDDMEDPFVEQPSRGRPLRRPVRERDEYNDTDTDENSYESHDGDIVNRAIDSVQTTDDDLLERMSGPDVFDKLGVVRSDQLTGTSMRVYTNSSKTTTKQKKKQKQKKNRYQHSNSSEQLMDASEYQRMRTMDKYVNEICMHPFVCFVFVT
jgi:hypothetical protein